MTIPPQTYLVAKDALFQHLSRARCRVAPPRLNTPRGTADLDTGGTHDAKQSTSHDVAHDSGDDVAIYVEYYLTEGKGKYDYLRKVGNDQKPLLRHQS